jgi:hypothetical protein
MDILLFLKQHPLIKNTLELITFAALGASSFLIAETALHQLKSNNVDKVTSEQNRTLNAGTHSIALNRK